MAIESKKIMDICTDPQSKHLVICQVTHPRNAVNPFRVVHQYHRDGLPGYYRKTIYQCGDLISALCFVTDLYRYGADTMQTPEFWQFCEDYRNNNLDR